VDFEYASPNPAAFDIANHFHEWTANYHSDKPWMLVENAYPSHLQRRNFYEAYLLGVLGSPPTEDQLSMVDFQVRVWSPASHAMWAIWGIVQAREELETGEVAEFDYLKYAGQRLHAFMKAVDTLLQG
jgi:choline kinase